MPDYIASRSVTMVGDSTGITFPKREITKSLGICVEQLQGEDVTCRLEGNEFIVELPTDN